MYKVRIIIINKFGEYIGKQVSVDNNGLDKIKKMSMVFYDSNGFELDCEDGNFLVLPPLVIKESILKLEIKNINNYES